MQNRWQADEWMSGRFSALDDEAAPTGKTDSVILNPKQWDGKLQYKYTVKSGRASRAQAGPHAAGGDGKDADGVDRDGDDGDDYEDDCWNDEDDDGGSCVSDREIKERLRNSVFSDDEVNELPDSGLVAIAVT